MPLHDAVLPMDAKFESRVDPTLADGVVRLTTEDLVHPAAN